MDGKSLKDILAGMKLRQPVYSAEEVLSEIERLIDTYRTAQEVSAAQGTPLGE